MTYGSFKLLARCALLAGLVAGAPATHASLSYVVTELSTLGGTSSYAYGINNSGDVVGRSDLNSGLSHATLWGGSASGAPTDIGFTAGGYGGFPSQAHAINDSGQVVGSYRGNNNWFPTFWTSGSARYTELNQPTGYGNQWDVFEINNIGQSVGYVYGSGPTYALFWTSSSANGSILAPLSGSNPFSYAYAINDKGAVAGQSSPNGNSGHAVIWSNSASAPTDLGTLGGANSSAWAINNGGAVVGEAQLASNAYHAAIWQNGMATDLGTLLGFNGSIAYDVNDAGVVVGTANSGPATNRAVAWLSGSTTPFDLNALVTLPGGVVLNEALGVNDKGQIIANASNQRAYLLTPVPLPAAIWLLGSALLAVFGVHRTRT